MSDVRLTIGDAYGSVAIAWGLDRGPEHVRGVLMVPAAARVLAGALLEYADPDVAVLPPMSCAAEDRSSVVVARVGRGQVLLSLTDGADGSTESVVLDVGEVAWLVESLMRAADTAEADEGIEEDDNEP